MVYATEVAKFSKEVIGFVKITLERCNNSFGDAPCTATGTVCYYSFPTCKDTPNYVKTTRDYKFQSAHTQRLDITQCRPYLESVSPTTTRIDPERSVTEHSRMEFVFSPDWGTNMPLTPIDHDKGSGNYNTETTGEYWRLLFKRNPNYNGRSIKYYEGFPADTEGSLQLKWAGIIENVHFDADGRCIVTATDELKDMKHVTIPNAVRSSNVTTVEIDADDTDIAVTDASEFKTFGKDIVVIDTNADAIRMPVETLDDDYVFAELDALAGTAIGLTYCNSRKRYYTTYNSSLYYFTPDDSTYTLVGSMGVAMYDIAWGEQDGVMYGSSGTRLYTIDLDTGLATDMGDHGAPGTIRGLCMDTRRNVLLAIQSAASDYIFEVNKTDGTVDDQYGTIGVTVTPTGLCYDEIEDCVYTLDSSGGAGHYAIVRCELDTVSGGGESLGELVNQNVQLSGIEIYHLSARAFVKIDDNAGDEYLELHGVDTATNTISVRRTGLNGTTCVSHGVGIKVFQVAPILDWDDTSWDTGMNVIDAMQHVLRDWNEFTQDKFNQTSFLEERKYWVSGVMVRGVIEKPTQSDKVMDWVRQTVGAHLWVNESQLITCKTTHPVNEHTETLATVTDAQTIIASKPPELDHQADEQVTRVVVYYDKEGSLESKTEEPDEYAARFVYINATTEGVNYLNKEITHTIFAPLVYREADAATLAIRYLRRYSQPVARYNFAVDRKDYATETGDLIEITSSDFMTNAGAADTRTFEVVQKKEDLESGLIMLETIDTNFTRQYGFIGHAGYADWTGASATEKQHAYIGGAAQADGKTYMSDGSEGYYIY